ncbi:capsular polysaccharide biosynthesis protein [Spirochaetia bacterium]|nr:capsular polysaccharide biosynthesis protein [Spirochaetia bacterium]
MPIVCVIALVLLFSGCGGEPQTPVLEVPPAEVSSYITIVAAGDNLVHDIIYNAARVNEGEEEHFNFDPSYALIKPIIEKADIAFVNQETVMGGKQFRYSGYPVFNTPQDAGLGLINAGFDVVNHASNHVMDRGEGAVFGTMDFWEAHKEIMYLGVWRSEEQRKTERRIIEKNGIKVGFLSYTYGLNGFVLPKDKPWLVGLIDKEVMAREIKELRPHCDLLTVSMHWGNEFRHDVSETQKELALFMAELGVDLVIGHHPHVTEPVEIIRRPGGGSMVVYYSLGDLLSHTQSDWTPDTITGGLAYIKVKKTTMADKSKCTIDIAGIIPTVCHYSKERRSPFTVYPLWDYTDELASRHYKNNLTVKYLNTTALRIFGLQVMSREQYNLYETRE